MEKRDLAFFYHSNCKPPGIVGLMEIMETNVIDPTQFEPTSHYYDPKASPDNPRWQTVTVKFKLVFEQIISLNLLKENFSNEELLVVKKGNRLSVMPVPKTTAITILENLVKQQ